MDNGGKVGNDFHNNFFQSLKLKSRPSIVLFYAKVSQLPRSTP